MTCKELFLFELNFTDSPSVANWASRSVKDYPAVSLPETFEELQKVPLDRSYNFHVLRQRSNLQRNRKTRC